ncbi:MAG: hypothetical protein ACOYXC_12655 [Candidatus Rifleibacteriota bacterium]
MQEIRSRGWTIIGLTGLSCLAAILLGFLLPEKLQMEQWYRSTTFYFILLNCIFWFICMAEDLAENSHRFITWVRLHYPALVGMVLLIIVSSVAVPGEFRILADETNLLGTSMSMYDSHECCNPTAVLNYFYGMKRTLESVIDMRPAFFPFHLYVFHSLFGYDPANGFRVNILAAFFILAIFYALIEPEIGKLSAFLGILVLFSFPLLILYIRSCGFETVNLLWLMILVFLCRMFLQNPQASKLEMIFLTLPLLAQTRYESALAVFCVTPVLLYKMPVAEYNCLSWKTVIAPFLFLPVAWLRIVTFSIQAFQVNSIEEAFSLNLVEKNFVQFVKFIFGHQREYGMVSILGFLAIAGLIKYMIDQFVNSKESEKKSPAFLLIVSGLAAVHLLARMAYFWGDLTLQYTSRLGLVFLPLLSFLAVYLLHSLSMWQNRLRYLWFVGVFALMIHGWPVAGQNLAVREIFFYREFRTVKQYLDRNFPAKDEYFLISDLANLYVPFRFSALYTGYARSNPEDILAQLQRRTYRHALVIQKINLNDGKPEENSNLGEHFRLETLYENQLHAGVFIRISRLNAVSEEN